MRGVVGPRREGEAGSSTLTVLGVTGVALVLVASAIAFVVLTNEDGAASGSDTQRQAEQAAARFVDAVNRGVPGEGGTVQAPGEVAEQWAATTGGLDGLGVVATAGDVALADDDQSATVPLTVGWTVQGATWDTTGTLQLTREQAGEGGDAALTATPWRAEWDIGALDARLNPGDQLVVEATASGRARILDGAGQPLVDQVPVVIVGVVPGDVPDTQALAGQLASLLDVDAAEVAADIDGAPDDQFVEIITLRRTDYDPIRDQLQPLPGTRFRESTENLAPNRNFARPILGSVGPADEEDVTRLEGQVQLGEQIGQSGIQARYDDRLKGAPGLQVRVIRASQPAEPGEDGSTSSTTTTAPDTPAPVDTLETVPPSGGQDVRLTLDSAAQQAAEDALAGDSRLTSLVAIRPSTMEVLAAATGPSGSAQNIAFNGQVAPGSTFKVVSSLAHIRKGLTPDQIVDCPANATAGGQSFRNADNFVLGSVPFREDFANSCNTAFVNLAADLQPNDLTDAAAAFGIGTEWDSGLGSYNGSVPPFDSQAAAAAASIGQGLVQASPLAMAAVAATVASGRWKPPVLVADPAPQNQPAEIPLDPTAAGYLRDMMAAVVDDGTATGALGGLPGDIFAKTGTAQFGGGETLQTNAWIIGWRDDVAFCVFVEGGSGGGSVAGPIAAQFLNAYQG